MHLLWTFILKTCESQNYVAMHNKLV